MPHSDENCYSKSGAFEWEDSRLPSEAALERLYLIAALALLYRVHLVSFPKSLPSMD